MDELKEAIFETWESITSNTTGSLVLSMPRHCAAVIAAHGRSTKYWTSKQKLRRLELVLHYSCHNVLYIMHTAIYIVPKTFDR